MNESTLSNHRGEISMTWMRPVGRRVAHAIYQAGDWELTACGKEIYGDRVPEAKRCKVCQEQISTVMAQGLAITLAN